MILFDDSNTISNLWLVTLRHAEILVKIWTVVAPIVGFFFKLFIHQMCSETETKTDTDNGLRP